jgi:TetR/AcrR family transcriptional regulator, cholesterol catabolism regulator
LTAPRDSADRPSRKQDILDAFARHVAARGFDGVALREIAEELDISKGTIVHHFGSKEQMLLDLHLLYLRSRLAEAEVILDRLPEPADQLSAIIYQNFVALRKDNAATVAFAREIVRFSRGEAMEPVRALRRQYSLLVRGIVTRGIADGSFREGDPRLITLQVFNTFSWAWTWLRTDGEWSIELIARSFIDTLFRGLVSPTSDEHLNGFDDVMRVVNEAMTNGGMSEF